MREIELVRSLRDMVDQLPHRDADALHEIRIRAKMVISNIFGDSRTYLRDLEAIRFRPKFSPLSEEYKDGLWQSGKTRLLQLINTMEEELKIFGVAKEVDKVQKPDVELSDQIFVVHGHDEAMKQAVARTLETIGLQPIILHEKPSKSRTIIEKFTDYSEVSFAVILLSPDDLAYARGESPEDARPRARQNVVFELGFFIGKLGRDRVLVLYQEGEDFEMPSDYSGVLYTPFDASGRWQFDLVKELNACGYDVDANILL